MARIENIHIKLIIILSIIFVKFLINPGGLMANESFMLNPEAGICKERLPETINRYQPAIVPVPTITGEELFFDRQYHPENSGGTSDFDEIWLSKKRVGNWLEPERIRSVVNNDSSSVLFSIQPNEGKGLVYGFFRDEKGKPSNGFAMFDMLSDFKEYEKLNIDHFVNKSRNFFGDLNFWGDVLIMSVEGEDSYGNLDLYASFYDKGHKSWTKPKNLGMKINSGGIEGTPYLAWDGRTLYFSSPNKNGRNDLDLFVSKRLDESWQNWSEPENLGSIINSAADENSIHLTALGDSAFIVSYDTINQRSGIYSVCIPKNLQPEAYSILSGRIIHDGSMGQHNSTEIVLESESESRIITNVTGEYYLVLKPGLDYKISFNSQGSGTYELQVRKDEIVPGWIRKDIHLKGKTEDSLTFSIYFDTNKSQAIPNQIEKLTNFVASHIGKNTRILVVGHADERGSEQYNMNLSKARALSISRYLGHMTNKRNIKTDWKGKSEPKSQNLDENRRVEVFILPD